MADSIKLSKSISLFKPIGTTPDYKRSDGPRTLIVFCSWMGASMRHIRKYVAGHQERDRGATILVIESSIADMTFKSDKAQQSSLSPARDVIVDHYAKHENPRIILHACSNGGAQATAQLARSFKNLPGLELVADALILDCCPGTYEPAQTASAMTTSIPQEYYLRTIAYACAHIWSTVYLIILRTARIEDSISRTRRYLNDGSYFNNSGARLYLHSAADNVVTTEAVKSHATDALNNGFAVRRAEFNTAGHCALLQEDNRKYWASIMDVLNKEPARETAQRSLL